MCQMAEEVVAERILTGVFGVRAFNIKYKPGICIDCKKEIY
jgi:hypothetical protein